VKTGEKGGGVKRLGERMCVFEKRTVSGGGCVEKKKLINREPRVKRRVSLEKKRRKDRKLGPEEAAGAGGVPGGTWKLLGKNKSHKEHQEKSTSLSPNHNRFRKRKVT